MGTINCYTFRPSCFSQRNHHVITKQTPKEGGKEHPSFLLLSFLESWVFITLNRGFLRLGRPAVAWDAASLRSIVFSMMVRDETSTAIQPSGRNSQTLRAQIRLSDFSHYKSWREREARIQAMTYLNLICLLSRGLATIHCPELHFKKPVVTSCGCQQVFDHLLYSDV